jgi:hypothetical protein
MGNSACGANFGDCCQPSQQNHRPYLRVVKLPDHSDGGNAVLCCMESKTQSKEWTGAARVTESHFFFDDTGSYETALTYESHKQRHGNCGASALEHTAVSPSACNPQTPQNIADAPALHYTAARTMPHGSNPTCPHPAAAASIKPKEPMVSRRPGMKRTLPLRAARASVRRAGAAPQSSILGPLHACLPFPPTPMPKMPTSKPCSTVVSPNPS